MKKTIAHGCSRLFYISLRGPERSVDIELSSRDQCSKKERYQLSSFFYEARDGARGPGDLGLRGPERSVDIELSNPGLGSKIKRSDALRITPF